MLRTIGRMIWIAISFLIASLAALLVLVTLGMERITEASAGAARGDLGGLDIWLGYLDQVRGAVALVSMLSIAPALLAVIAGEVARIRSALYWVAAGGAALAAIPFLMRLTEAGAATALPQAALLQVLATAGFAAGIVYWALAGRTA